MITRKRKRKPKRGFWFFLLLFILLIAAWLVIGNRHILPAAPDTTQTSDDNKANGGTAGNKNSDAGRISDKERAGSPTSSSADPEFPASIPPYNGQDVIELNGNRPSFSEEDLHSIQGENYSDLDELGRCGQATAMLDRSMRPTGSRGNISSIRPSGWRQKKYPGLVDSEPPFLYNRCHLIAYGMTGQEANEKNLITGTRYMNAVTMLPYEEKVMQYLDYSANHVLYRVTPHFTDTELVARGVEMEAWSVEDNGAGISFHVFVYNIQPGIEIDYLTGESHKSGP